MPPGKMNKRGQGPKNALVCLYGINDISKPMNRNLNLFININISVSLQIERVDWYKTRQNAVKLLSILGISRCT